MHYEFNLCSTEPARLAYSGAEKSFLIIPNKLFGGDRTLSRQTAGDDLSSGQRCQRSGEFRAIGCVWRCLAGLRQMRPITAKMASGSHEGTFRTDSRRFRWFAGRTDRPHRHLGRRRRYRARHPGGRQSAHGLPGVPDDQATASRFAH
jgi:hypothetical protein